jgi:phosphohistidine swiveling domain-containing protein
LERLLRAGIAVPDGWLTTTASAALSATPTAGLEALLRGGPVIVRGAFPDEDGAVRSAAGLSETVPDCTSIAAISAAVQAIAARRTDRAVVAYFGAAPTHADVLIQRQVPRALLVVVAARANVPPMLEVHGSSPEALAWGATPRFSGPLDAWDHPLASSLGALVANVLTHVTAPRGVDLEIVVDSDGNPWVVQARPLTVDPFPRWTTMKAAIEEAGPEEGPRPTLDGLLLLDAEHNPAPLSVAHTWLIHTLAARRPNAGSLQVLAGWLYTHTLPRDLEAPTATLPPTSALRVLHDSLLPRARAGHQTISTRLTTASADEIVACLGEAVDGFVEMFDNYLRILIPSRRGFSRAPNQTAPLSLRDRRDYLDVLPTAWDLASPSLDDLGIGGSLDATPPARAPTSDAAQGAPSEEEAATLLSEIDDHYFALGLAPLRAVWLAAAKALKLPPELVFFLSGEELTARLEGAMELSEEVLRSRRRRHARRAELSPPERIFNGAPFPITRPALHGVPVGQSVSGRLIVRRDLEDLWRRPPAPGEIIATPALTAPAAVALAESPVAAICTEYGGALSHGVLMARELGLSALIGCRGCTSIRDGAAVRMDTERGVLNVLDDRHRDDPRCRQ